MDPVFKNLIDGITVPSPDSGTSAQPASIFDEKRRAAWNSISPDEARCDLAPNRIKSVSRFPEARVMTLWKKSVMGPTLKEIKLDPDMIRKFADGMAALITQCIGQNLAEGDWAIVTSPKRRHKERNFAALVSHKIAATLRIPFVEDLVGCRTLQRVSPEFHLLREIPTQRNIIVFDDILTTGSTLKAMHALLAPLGLNLSFFAAIDNK